MRSFGVPKIELVLVAELHFVCSELPPKGDLKDEFELAEFLFPHEFLV